MVKAKFVCVEKVITESRFASGPTRRVQFEVVTGDTSEHKVFFDATPAGEVWMDILSQDAFDQFEIGKVYDLTFAAESTD